MSEQAPPRLPHIPSGEEARKIDGSAERRIMSEKIHKQLLAAQAAFVDEVLQAITGPACTEIRTLRESGKAKEALKELYRARKAVDKEVKAIRKHVLAALSEIEGDRTRSMLMHRLTVPRHIHHKDQLTRAMTLNQ